MKRGRDAGDTKGSFFDFTVDLEILKIAQKYGIISLFSKILRNLFSTYLSLVQIG